jgi:hypothetical protein
MTQPTPKAVSDAYFELTTMANSVRGDDEKVTSEWALTFGMVRRYVEELNTLAAERDAAVQKARYESDVAAQAMAAKDAAERERGDADDALAACQAQAAGTIAQLREKLDEAERIIEAAHDVVAWQGTAKEPEMYSALVSALNARTAATAQRE